MLDPCNSASFHPGIAPLCCVNAYHDGVGALKDSSPCWFMRPVVSAKLLHGRGIVSFQLAVSEMLGLVFCINRAMLTG